ncbi:hypothetical protein SLS57_006509 [Botryosphaeria dothidea]
MDELTVLESYHTASSIRDMILANAQQILRNSTSTVDVITTMVHGIHGKYYKAFLIPTTPGSDPTYGTVGQPSRVAALERLLEWTEMQLEQKYANAQYGQV